MSLLQFTAGQQLRMQASWAQYRSSAQQQEVVRNLTCTSGPYDLALCSAKSHMLSSDAVRTAL